MVRGSWLKGARPGPRGVESHELNIRFSFFWFFIFEPVFDFSSFDIFHFWFLISETRKVPIIQISKMKNQKQKMNHWTNEKWMIGTIKNEFLEINHSFQESRLSFLKTFQSFIFHFLFFWCLTRLFIWECLIVYRFAMETAPHPSLNLTPRSKHKSN